MSTTATVVSNFFNQNFYGFCLLLIAAFFFYHGMNEAAQAFSFIGSTLMGVRQFLPPQNSALTVNTDRMDHTTVNENQPKTGN